MAINLVKPHLGVQLWWSSKDVDIQQHLWAVLCIALVLQAPRLEITARVGVAVFDVSIALLVRYLPQFAQRGEDPVAAFVARGRAASFIRPARRVVMQLPDPPLAHAWSRAPTDVCRVPRHAGTR